MQMDVLEAGRLTDPMGVNRLWRGVPLPAVEGDADAAQRHLVDVKDEADDRAIDEHDHQHLADIHIRHCENGAEAAAQGHA